MPIIPLPQSQFDRLQLDDSDILPPSPPSMNHIYNIPEVNEESLSFFFPFYQQYLFPTGRFPNQPADDESKLPAPFRTYDSPVWNNWAEIWNKSPIELEINTVSHPELDFLFQSVLFRLTLNPTFLDITTPNNRFIKQGTTFTFKGYDHEEVRFVAEWLHFIHNHSAYVKIVAMNSTGARFPFTDPDFPSFILIAPLCLVYLPTPPPGLELYYAYPLDTEDDESVDENTETCWACNLVF